MCSLSGAAGGGDASGFEQRKLLHPRDGDEAAVGDADEDRAVRCGADGPGRIDGDGADQMVHAGGGEAHVVNIFNRNSGPADVKYSVIVQNRATGETRDCDPRIINR